ncbi:MAG TPA: type II toxin-antitoxin system RelE/ParE family toxin [Thermoanaerobaculia bacterium]|nr:type II toxin-antitoxin system RelE/ParE family toxin [Thermoanaerobaculia bacterium]
MKVRVVSRGLWTLYAVCTDRGDCPLLEFLADTTSSHLAKTKRQMLRRLEMIAQTGVVRVTEISHQIAEDIWQIEKGDIRILYFYDKGRVILLSHGFVKETQKTRPAEIQRAQEALRRYRAERHELKIIED